MTKYLIAAALALASGVAAAQSPESGWYAGIDAGRSRASASGIDSRDNGYGINGGYQFNRHFALEGAYTRLGDFGYAVAVPDDALRGSLNASALSLAAVGLLPVWRNVSLYGKAGLAYTRTELDLASDSGATPTQNDSHSGTGLVLGAGAQYDFTRTLFARAGWERYADVGDSTTGKGDIDLYKVGFGMRF